jgi:hypothetical protein
LSWTCILYNWGAICFTWWCHCRSWWLDVKRSHFCNVTILLKTCDVISLKTTSGNTKWLLNCALCNTPILLTLYANLQEKNRFSIFNDSGNQNTGQFQYSNGRF